MPSPPSCDKIVKYTFTRSMTLPSLSLETCSYGEAPLHFGTWGILVSGLLLRSSGWDEVLALQTVELPTHQDALLPALLVDNSSSKCKQRFQTAPRMSFELFSRATTINLTAQHNKDERLHQLTP